MPNTTSIASATQPPGLRANAVGSASCWSGTCVPALVCASDMQFRLHRFGRLLRINTLAGQAPHHIPCRLRSHGFDLRPRSLARVADLGLRLLKLGVELVGGGFDLRLGVAGAGVLRL